MKFIFAATILFTLNLSPRAFAHDGHPHPEEDEGSVSAESSTRPDTAYYGNRETSSLPTQGYYQFPKRENESSKDIQLTQPNNSNLNE